jgi:Response regulator containing CheY-like receiver domain and AraC-type DNA-binding domain
MESKLYKVLIADDEYWTREKIRNMIPWEQYKLEFLEPAVDGEDVLAKIKENTPDILITDINMPFINGVELLSIIQKKYPNIITFVISGYDDFNYVKSAFMAGSINYLVKPVAKMDLVNALSKALIIISERQDACLEKEKEKIKLLKAASLIQDCEFSQLLTKEESSFTPTITMSNNIDFAGSSLILLKIHNLSELSRQNQYDINTLSFVVKKQIKEIISNDDVIVFNHMYRSNEFIILSELYNAELKRIADKLIMNLCPKVNSPITICISDHTYSLDSIHMAYVQAVSLLMIRKFNRKNYLLVSENQIKDKKIYNQFMEEHEKQLRRFLFTGNLISLKQLVFENINLRHCQELGWEYLDVKQTVKRILNIINDSVVQNMTPQHMIDFESMVDMADKAIESLDVDYLCDIIEDIIEFAVPADREEASESISAVVKQAVKYIDAHYFEELTLASLSVQFNVESSYFSKMFRQQTKETLMVYIAKKRIGKAMEYMKNLELSLNEIAFMVGYDDYTYFNRVFRKIAGKSPKDYRNSINTVNIL